MGITYEDWLMHHGILGQRWGRKNGPPYPLGASDHSASEKRAGWRKSLDRSSAGTKKKFKLSDRQKTALKIGAGVAVAGLAVYGAYKLKDIDRNIDIDRALKNVDTSVKIGDIPNDFLDKANKIDYSKTVEEQNAGKTLKRLADDAVPKTIDDMFGNLSDDNPLKKDPQVRDNCTNVVLAAIGRAMGYDVIPGYQRDENGNFKGNEVQKLVDCFKTQTDNLGNSILKSSKGSHCDSYEKASALLTNPRFKNPEGSYGYFSSKFLIDGQEFEHAITWRIENGKAVFGDGVYGKRASEYFSHIMPDANVYFFRADNNELVDSEYRKYVFYR